MRGIDEILKFAMETPPPTPPDPYEIALRLSCALIASGKYDNAEAAIGAGWAGVMPFYAGKSLYLELAQRRGQMAGYVSPPEPDMTRAEARAYVAGEAGATPPSEMYSAVDLEAIQAKQRAISEATLAVQAAKGELDQAEGADDRETAAGKRRIAGARKTFEAACKVQSEAYL